ncbi:MAG TPA: class I SAM-dependent methyltransferase [Kofleriaceae bacterium]|jgi:SAM-dependent methyltransferase/uncharacterized protein YbaR (Trm112 family)|nr:class I SAM-dependent methyltransferase [Kofleriaceae bacterium]
MEILLVCPACRTVDGDRIDVRTIEREGAALGCACGRRYPIVGGVPVVFAEPPDPSSIATGELDPETAALLAEPGPDDAPYPRLLEHISIYFDAHWGDRAEPAAPLASEALVAKLAERANHRVASAVELGCSAGRMLAELARGADHVVGVDIQHGVLRRARRLLAGEPVAYGRRLAGRHYTTATARAGDRATAATLVCGDALDPPLVPGAFERVVALNLLDVVRRPRHLLTVLDALCMRGGEIIISSPYAWQSSHVDEGARLGAADPAGAVRELVATGLSRPYTIEDEAELPWSLRRDARSAATYRIHYIRARKG